MKHLILIIGILWTSQSLHAQIWEKMAMDPSYTLEEIKKAVELDFGPVSSRSELDNKIYKKYKRWEEIQESHIGPDGKLFNYAATNWGEYQKVIKSQNSIGLNGRTASWIDVSPTEFSPDPPYNGRVNCIAIHPTNSNIIFIGTVLGGLWKTSDGGSSWTPLTDGLPTIGVSSILIHPVTPNVMYIATGVPEGRYVPSVGILKSDDGGYTWNPTNVTFGFVIKEYIYKLAMDPNNPSVMYAVGTCGLLRTTDGWNTHTNVDPAGTSWRDIEFKPGSSDTIYATSYNMPFRSIDGGINWDNLEDNGIGLYPNGLPFEYNRIAIGVTPVYPNAVYFLYTIDSTYAYKGLFYSHEPELNFTLQSTTPNIIGKWAWWDLDILVDPTSANIVYACGIDIWKSYDYGVTWTQIVNGSGLPGVHPDVHNLIQRGNTLYCGSDGGISTSHDGGASWTNISDGLNIMQFYDIDFRDNRLMGGTQDNGSMKWDEGDIEGDFVIGGDGFECMFNYENPSIIYGSTQDNRYKSINGGGSFFNITPFGETGHWGQPWIMHPVHPDTLYASMNTVYRTYSGGQYWTEINPGFNVGIAAMAQSPVNTDIFYVATGDSIRKTLNVHSYSQPVWEDITVGLPDISQGISSLTIDDTNPDRIWVSYHGYNSNHKVHYSPDGGTNWYNRTGSLPNIPTLVIVYEPGSSDDGLYLGTDIGVFYRNNTLGDWIFYSNGLPATLVKDIHIRGTDIYAGTFGRGIWKSEIYNTCPSFWTLTQGNDPSNPHSTGYQFYEASNGVTSTRIITGGVGTDVTYQGGNSVILSPGFHAKSSNLFTARIGNCGL